MTELRQRDPRQENKAFLAFVRSKPCCACGASPPVQAAHLRQGCPERGKRPTGIGERPSDSWAVPLCALCHLTGREALHKLGEQRFWKRIGKDPFQIAADLFAEFSS